MLETRFVGPNERTRDPTAAVYRSGDSASTGCRGTVHPRPRNPLCFQFFPHSFKMPRNSLKTIDKAILVTHLFSTTCALFLTLFLEVLCFLSVPQNIPGVYPPAGSRPQRHLALKTDNPPAIIIFHQISYAPATLSRIHAVYSSSPATIGSATISGTS